MAFEKMTAKDLFNKLATLLPNTFGFWEGTSVITKYSKIGARMLRIEMATGLTLYFLWYDDNNWNLGTKPFRNRPKKQIYNQVRKDLSTGKGMIETFEKIYRVNNPKNEFGGVPIDEAVQQMKMAEAKGFHEGMITGCNHPEPIDWVKDNPDMFEKGIRVTFEHPEWDDVVPRLANEADPNKNWFACDTFPTD